MSDLPASSNSPPQLRVRHLVKGLGPGGAERLVVSQATRHSDGVDYSVDYLLPHKNHLVPELEAGGVSVRLLPGPRVGWMRHWRRQLIADPVDIVHGHSPAISALARIAVATVPRRVRPVLVGTEHNRWPRHRYLTRLANRLTIRREAATIAVSDDVASTVRGAKAGQVRTIVHGIDLAAVRATAARNEVRAELGVGDTDIVVVCVANLRREKALDDLVLAAATALESEPRLFYVLVGQGPLADDVAGWVAQAGIGDRFVALGYRADATRVVSGADVFTMSSRHEGTPVAIMEALAHGVPVVATSAGGIADAVGTAGITTPIGNPRELAAGHLDLAADPERRQELSRCAVAEADRFSIDRAIGEIVAIYRTAAGSGTAA